MDEKAAFEIIKAGTRDHARILLPFEENKRSFENKLNSSNNSQSDIDNSAYAIFSQQQADKEIFEAYKTLIQLRKNNPELIYGDFELLNNKKDRFVYKRGNATQFIIDCNLADKKQKAFVAGKEYELLFDTAVNPLNENNVEIKYLNAYQARIYKRVGV